MPLSTITYKALQELVSKAMNNCPERDLVYGYVMTSWPANRQKSDMVLVSSEGDLQPMLDCYLEELSKQESKVKNTKKKDVGRIARVEIKISDLRDKVCRDGHKFPLFFLLQSRHSY